MRHRLSSRFALSLMTLGSAAVASGCGSCRGGDGAATGRAGEAEVAADTEPPLLPLEALAVAALYVADATSERARPVELGGALGERLKGLFAEESWGLRWAPDWPGPAGGFVLRAAVYYDLTQDGEVDPELDEGLASAAVTLYAERRLESGLRERFEHTGRAEAPLARAGRPEAELAADYLELVVRAARAARDQLESALRLQRGEGDELAAALRSGDAERQLGALAFAAERRAEAVVDDIVPLLDAEEPELVAAAITALGAIDTEGSVRPLAKLTRRNDPEILFWTVTALGRMKNPLARKYLEGIAETHAYDSVREEAQRALEALDGGGDDRDE